MNLILTCPRHFEEETKAEIIKICNEFGDENPEFNISTMPGIITGKTSLNPVKFIQNIHKKILDEPWSIRYCLRIIPIQSVCVTNINEINLEIQKKINVFKPNESYRITVEKRNFKISSQEIISKIAKSIPNKVSLENPDWVVLVEIIGEQTGIAVVPNNSILSVEKVKRSLSD